MDKIEQALGMAVLEDFKSVLAAADEAGAGPMEWQAITEILPEQAKEWCCKMVDGNVEAGDYSGEMHMIGEIATGRQIAVTGCGPKGAVSAKFLIWAAHFAMKHREALPELLAAAEEAATLRAELAGMKAALEQISTYSSNKQDEFKPQFDAFWESSSECADCKKAAARDWPPSSLCDNHYRSLERLKASESHAIRVDETYGPRDIARTALDRAREVGK